jgi:hypothetical protein
MLKKKRKSDAEKSKRRAAAPQTVNDLTKETDVFDNLGRQVSPPANTQLHCDLCSSLFLSALLDHLFLQSDRYPKRF